MMQAVRRRLWQWLGRVPLTPLRPLLPLALSPRHHPTLSLGGALMLARLRLQRHGPRLANYSGSRLSPADLALLAERYQQWLDAPLPGDADAAALRAWRAAAIASVPRYRHYPLDAPLHQLPTLSRADLADIWSLVPERRPHPQLLCFTTSGTTGEPLRIPSDPLVAASYLIFHRRALQLFGLQPSATAGEVGIVLAGHQRHCFSYASVNPLAGECGLVKLNLDPGCWRQPDHRRRYLDALKPELISGDPLSLTELARLGLNHRPKALLSTSMALSDGLRQQLEQQLGAPLLDIYSLNELGPIAVYHPAVDAHLLLQPQQWLEIVDDAGQPLADGEWGEICVSGGFNPWLPLLRYRTGDYACKVTTPLGPGLRQLQGRAPVRFRHPLGHWLNKVDISQLLRPLPLRRFALHQYADGALELRCDGPPAAANAAVERLRQLFGPNQPLQLLPLTAADKVRQFTTALAAAQPEARP